MEKTDIIIVGGGIAGLSTAYELTRRRPGASIIVLESGPRAGEGASWANGSMVHPSQATPWAESGCENAAGIARETYRLAARSSDLIAQNLDAFGIEPRHRRQGCAKIYQSHAAMDADMERLLNLVSEGLRIEVLPRAQILKHLSIADVQIPIKGGVIFPDDHTGPPRYYCAALLEKLRDAGVTVRVNAKVSNAEGGRVTLNTGEILQAETVVLCAGAGLADLPGNPVIKPVRGYSRTFDMPSEFLPNMAIMDDTAHISVTPLGDHLRVSGGADIDTDAGIYDRLETYALALLAPIKDRLRAAPKSDWTAQRPMSDCGPVIARLAPGLFANTGHGHMGWTLSAGAAEAAADLILRG